MVKIAARSVFATKNSPIMLLRPELCLGSRSDLSRTLYSLAHRLSVLRHAGPVLIKLKVGTGLWLQTSDILVQKFFFSFLFSSRTCSVLSWPLNHFRSVFTARCTIVQSTVLRSQVVCLSVTVWRWWIVICAYLGWKSWKLIVRTIRSRRLAKRSSTYSQGNMGKFWAD